MVQILSAAFGGESGGSTPAASPLDGKDVTEGVTSFEAALSNMNNILKWG